MADGLDSDFDRKRRLEDPILTPPVGSGKTHRRDAVDSAAARGVELFRSPSSSSSSSSSGTVLEDVCNPFLMRTYYDRIFPYRHMFRWLSYSQDPDKDSPLIAKDFFARREISFTINSDGGEAYIRYLSFRDEAAFAREVMRQQPIKIDIGAVFSLPPSKHQTYKKEVFRPVERELVFDIDMTDYDEIRTCCTGANICHRCWPFMTVAIKVMDRGLREDFGFRHIFWVYSGRRGVHCWVCDKSARALANDARTAIVEYFSAISGSVETNRKNLVSLSSPIHPALFRAYTELEAMFVETMLPDEGQGYLGNRNPDRWERILAFIPEIAEFDIAGTLREKWAERDNTPARRWAQLKSAVDSVRSQIKGAIILREKLDKIIPTIVFALTYPRLDVNVTKGMNHLLKSPFCIHPKTGRVCVPITYENCDKFDPFAVPTVAELCDELGRRALEKRERAEDASAGGADADEDAGEAAGGGGGGGGSGGGGSRGSKAPKPGRDMLETALGPFVEEWEANFLKPMEKSNEEAMRAMAKARALPWEDW